MTCIVGLEHNGRVYIGADSMGSNGYLQHPPFRRWKEMTGNA